MLDAKVDPHSKKKYENNPLISGGVMTVNEAFAEFLKRIELNQARATQLSDRYIAIKETIEGSISGADVFQIGSFQRKTKIRPTQDNNNLDIDVGVCLGEFSRYVPGGVYPAEAVETLENSIAPKGSYKKIRPYVDAPTIVLEYADGFKFELVPCYRDKSGKYHRENGPDCYVIPDSNNTWIAADYKYDAAFISGMNQKDQVKQVLVPSIKMIKKFVENNNICISSFHTEAMCAISVPGFISFWESRKQKWHYQHILAAWLDKASEYVLGDVSIPGSYSGQLELEGNMLYRTVISGSLKALSKTAWEICNITNSDQAISAWHKLIGEPFPH